MKKIFMATIMLVSIMMVACGGTGQSEEGQEIPAGPEGTPTVSKVKVETPYTDLYYSGEWEDKISAEIINGNYECEIIFYGTVKDIKEKLFVVNFGNGKGFPVGTIYTPMGYEIDVTAEFVDIEQGSMEKTTFETFCAMQEQLNYVLQELKNNDSFTGINN